MAIMVIYIYTVILTTQYSLLISYGMSCDKDLIRLYHDFKQAKFLLHHLDILNFKKEYSLNEFHSRTEMKEGCLLCPPNTIPARMKCKIHVFIINIYLGLSKSLED